MYELAEKHILQIIDGFLEKTDYVNALKLYNAFYKIRNDDDPRYAIIADSQMDQKYDMFHELYPKENETTKYGDIFNNRVRELEQQSNSSTQWEKPESTNIRWGPGNQPAGKIQKNNKKNRRKPFYK